MDDSPSPIAGWKADSGTDSTAPFPRADAPLASGRVSVSVPSDAAGHQDWARASDKVRKRFKELLDDPATKAAFVTPEEAPGMSQEQAHMLGMMALSAVFQIQALAAALKFRLNKEELQQCFSPDFKPYPDFDKALARVLQKRGPEWLAVWADELYVGSVIVMASLAGWAKAGSVAAEKKKKVNGGMQEESVKGPQAPSYTEPGATQ